MPWQINGAGLRWEGGEFPGREAAHQAINALQAANPIALGLCNRLRDSLNENPPAFDQGDLFRLSKWTDFNQPIPMQRAKDVFTALFNVVLDRVYNQQDHWIQGGETIYRNWQARVVAVVSPEGNGPFPVPQVPLVSTFGVSQLALQSRQVILYGPPGTGKTRVAKRAALELLNPGSVCPTFQCPVCNTPVRLTEQNANQEVECQRAGCQGRIQMPAEVADQQVEESLSGTAQQGRFELVVFHPSYEYEQFVGGISPTNDGNGALAYLTKPGRFLRLCLMAQLTHQPVVLIIDEINRGNLPKLLGELIYALEYRGERRADGVEINAVALPFSYANPPEDARRQTIVIPRNLYIIGTMNSSDRSIGHIDAAVRRRFPQMLIPPDPAVVRNAWAADPACGDLLANLMTDINNELAAASELGDEIGVGHSYFLFDPAVMGPGGEPNPRTQVRNKWKYQVEPLLREYRNVTSLEQATIVAWRNRLHQILG